MRDLIYAIGLLLVVEGLLYAVFPNFMKRAMVLVLSQSSEQLRYSGLAAATIGVGLIWLFKSFIWAD